MATKSREVTEKREIPPFLKKVLRLDEEWTKRFVSFSLHFVAVRSLKTHCKFLEVSTISRQIIWRNYVNIFSFTFKYSCHGIVWLATLLGFVWLIDNPNYYESQMNLLFGLVLDILFVASIKAATRRKRPSIDNDLFTIGPDKFR